MENLIGGTEGNGFIQVMRLFNINRMVASAQGVGVAQGAMDKAVAYIRERTQFGAPLASFQGLQFKIAEMAARLESARLLYHKAAWLMDHGQVDRKLVSIAKLVAGETAVRVTDEALQLHGGYGYMDEYDVERFYRDAKIVLLRQIAKIKHIKSTFESNTGRFDAGHRAERILASILFAVLSIFRKSGQDIADASIIPGSLDLSDKTGRCRFHSLVPPGPLN